MNRLWGQNEDELCPRLAVAARSLASYWLGRFRMPSTCNGLNSVFSEFMAFQSLPEPQNWTLFGNIVLADVIS